MLMTNFTFLVHLRKFLNWMVVPKHLVMKFILGHWSLSVNLVPDLLEQLFKGTLRQFELLFLNLLCLFGSCKTLFQRIDTGLLVLFELLLDL